jgi:hypothetical protein
MMQDLERRIINLIFILKFGAFDLPAVSSDNIAVNPYVFNCHFILGQGSGFIRANTRSGAERLHSF